MTEKVQKYIEQLKDKKVAFVGMGVANVPCAEFLASFGVTVFACDSKDEEYVGKDVCNRLKSLGVHFSLGDTYLDVLPEMDIIFRSNGIMPLKNPWIGECIGRGQKVTTEMEVFFELCPAKIIAITGSNGKTTTTTLISEMLKADGYNVYMGGNIGKAMMPCLNSITKDDIAVVELSSFQLMTMDNIKNKPDIALFTNIEATHLDWHSSLDEYVNAKRNLLINQSSHSKCILNADCDYSIGGSVNHDIRHDVRGSLFEFSIQKKVDNGAYLAGDGSIIYNDGGMETLIMNRNDIRLPGLHNVENYCAAICTAWGLVKPDTMKKIPSSFAGVEHRIEFVREFDGVKYYNDSIATSPSRVISGLRAFDKKIIVIQGGSDKGNDLSVMTDDLIKYTKLIVLNGATAERIENAVKSNPSFNAEALEIMKVKTLEEAVMYAKEQAVSGDIVSLCPACPAFDQFKTFEYRGRKFKEIVNGF